MPTPASTSRPAIIVVLRAYIAHSLLGTRTARIDLLTSLLADDASQPLV